MSEYREPQTIMKEIKYFLKHTNLKILKFSGLHSYGA